MTTMTTSAPKPGPTSRPRPGPGHGVAIAPQTADSFAPWVAMLEQRFPTDRYRWVVYEDGALMPVPLDDDEAEPGGKWQALSARLGSLLRR